MKQTTKQIHTQGEWEVSNRIFLHVEAGTQWICQLSNLENTNKNFLSDEYDAEERRLKEEQQANAKLIAAAPELLEALIKISISLEQLPCKKSDFNMVLKAINKATL